MYDGIGFIQELFLITKISYDISDDDFDQIDKCRDFRLKPYEKVKLYARMKTYCLSSTSTDKDSLYSYFSRLVSPLFSSEKSIATSVVVDFLTRVT